MSDRKIYASEITYIDPVDCGSSVGFIIKQEGSYFSAEIDLSDCTRGISWYFNENTEDQKIENIIKTFQTFKKEFINAKKQLEREKKTKK